MYSRKRWPMRPGAEVPSSSHSAGFTWTIRSWESVTAMPSGAPSMAIRNCSSLRASSRLARSSSVTSRMAIAVRRPGAGIDDGPGGDRHVAVGTRARAEPHRARRGLLPGLCPGQRVGEPGEVLLGDERGDLPADDLGGVRLRAEDGSDRGGGPGDPSGVVDQGDHVQDVLAHDLQGHLGLDRARHVDHLDEHVPARMIVGQLVGHSAQGHLQPAPGGRTLHRGDTRRAGRRGWPAPR